MKTFFAIISGILTVLAGLFTALSGWIGIIAGVLFAFTAGYGFILSVLAGVAVGVVSYLGALIIGSILTTLLALVTGLLIK